MKYVLVIVEDKTVVEAIRTFSQAQYSVDVVADKNSGLAMSPRRRYEFIFFDIALLNSSAEKDDHPDYRKEFQPFWNLFPGTEIIVLTSKDKIREAVKAVKAGASDYLSYPFSPDELKYVTENLLESQKVQSELDYLRGSFWDTDSWEVVQTNNERMRSLLEKVKSVALTKTTVLLTGETGVGKGVIAKLIHQHSNRRDNKFISIHCGAIPETLLESELFGHEKGAFTGAIRKKLGKFEIAEKGTIFLDEIGTISASAQIKLLQILQEKTFQRVGGEETIEVDVRILAASNIDLKKLSDDGAFRKDLYYRINVLPVEIPPLRERSEDIPLLVRNMLKKLNQSYLKEIHNVHPKVMEALQSYPWPGNIRELENLIERVYVLENSSLLMPESFPVEIFAYDAPGGEHSTLDTSLTLEEVRRRGIEKIETQYLKELLASNKGRINTSAEAAGISTRQLHKLMKKYGIKKEEFK